MSNFQTNLSIVVPVYKEEGNIKPFLNRTLKIAEKITSNFEVIFALDPSSDMTEEMIVSAALIEPRIKLICMSRRFGQPAAVYAGLRFASGEAVAVIDADLQDPPELLLELHSKLKEGFDVVYATRRSRDGESIVKKVVAWLGYRAINRLSDISIPPNTGDYRIMSRRVVNEVINLNETHGFLRGLVAFVGFNQTGILYDRDKRYAGKGNYNRYFGSLRIGFNGIVGFSSKPLNLMSIVGGLVAGISFLTGFAYLLQTLFGFKFMPGFPTTIILVSFFSGIQLLSLGLLGEYVSRIYDEVKNRPMYIVEKKVGFDEPN